MTFNPGRIRTKFFSETGIGLHSKKFIGDVTIMAQLKLPRDERITLRAAAHHLDPVVLLGASGLTEAVKKKSAAPSMLMN